MLALPSSFNGKLILESYQQAGIKEEKHVGWVSVGQKSNLKGLKLLIQAVLPNGDIIPKDSIIYIKEELLHTSPWAKDRRKSNTLPGEFILVNMNDVEYIAPTGGSAA